MTSADLSDGADGRVTEPLRSRRNHWNNQVRRHALTIPDAPALKYEIGRASCRERVSSPV